MAGRGGKRSTSFKPGQSGNPGGRPKIAGDLKELARAHTTDAVKTLVALLTCKSPTARAVAANSLLDRGYGKATQHVEANVNLIDKMSLDEQRALAEALSTLARDEADASSGVNQTHH